MFRKVLYIIIILFINHLSASAQQGYALTGTIQDAQTKEPLSFATIQLQTADKTCMALSATRTDGTLSPNYHPENIQQLYLIWDMTS